MRKLLATILFCLVLTGTGCSNKPENINQQPILLPSPTQISQQPNFSFIFRDTPCGVTPKDIYNSNTKTLIHTPIAATESITISLQLKDDELNEIFQKSIENNFFDLPLILIPPADMISMMSAPASLYELNLTNGEINHSVSLNTEIITDPLYEDAEKFIDLFFLIRNIIRENPEYKNLPEDSAGCA